MSIVSLNILCLGDVGFNLVWGKSLIAESTSNEGSGYDIGELHDKSKRNASNNEKRQERHDRADHKNSRKALRNVVVFMRRPRPRRTGHCIFTVEQLE